MDDTASKPMSITGIDQKPGSITGTSNNPDELKEVAPKPLHEYPGMEIVEEEKLSWTGDLPPVASSQLSNLSARFGLDGSLLPHDFEVPVQVI